MTELLYRLSRKRFCSVRQLPNHVRRFDKELHCAVAVCPGS